MARDAYPLTRYSSNRQEGNDSERRQTDWHKEVCKAEGWRLNNRYNIVDRAKSAFHGDNLRGRFGAFLDLVNAGKVPPGGVLLAEELDRVTRLERKQALPLVMGILAGGIDIRTRGRLWTESDIDDLGGFINLTIDLESGHKSSKKTSERIGALWANWRKLVGEGEDMRKQGKKPDPVKNCGRIPPWLDWDDGRGKPLGMNWAIRKELKVPFRGFVLVPEAAAAIKLAFELVAGGMGLRRVLARLNGEDGEGEPVPCHGARDGQWKLPYLAKLLRWQAVLGHKTGADVTHVVHRDVYPAAVDAKLFYRARARVEAREFGGKGSGRPARERTNLFASLLVNARDGGALHIHTQTNGKRQLKGEKSINRQRGADPSTFPLNVFEKAAVATLREVDPAKVLGEVDEADDVVVARGKLAKAEKSLRAVNAALDRHPDNEALLDRLAIHQGEAKAAQAELDAAKAAAANPLGEAWDELKAAAVNLDDEAQRLRFRAELRRVVEKVYCLVITHDRYHKVMVAQFRFAGGRQRVMVIEYSANRGDKVKGWWRVASDRGFVHDPSGDAWIGLAPFDLGDPAGVGAVLDAVDVEGERAFEGRERHPLG
jgi:hypothetical protein